MNNKIKSILMIVVLIPCLVFMSACDDTTQWGEITESELTTTSNFYYKLSIGGGTVEACQIAGYLYLKDTSSSVGILANGIYITSGNRVFAFDNATGWAESLLTGDSKTTTINSTKALYASYFNKMKAKTNVLIDLKNYETGESLHIANTLTKEFAKTVGSTSNTYYITQYGFILKYQKKTGTTLDNSASFTASGFNSNPASFGQFNIIEPNVD